jgi:hypothetical protein
VIAYRAALGGRPKSYPRHLTAKHVDELRRLVKVSPESRKTSTSSSGSAKKITAYWDVA